MSNYLQVSRQRVKLDGTYSDWKPIKTGFPQGSLLGPLLLNININDLNLQVRNTSLPLFGCMQMTPDDTCSEAITKISFKSRHV